MSQQPLNIVIFGDSLPAPPSSQPSALYVRIAKGFPMGPFVLFDVWTGDGYMANDLTARQVEHVAQQRGLRVVPVVEPKP